ncbi:MAG TPA: hypothetical protein VK581_12675 [Chthoniobacterales bacterium]|nr:hypothetical protein [Chthoniobacterales bacterium]
MSQEPDAETHEREVRRNRRRKNFPKANDANIRVVCNEIADDLSKNWRFKLHVGGLVVGSFVALVAAIAGIVGWSVSATLTRERQTFEDNAKKEIGTAKEAIERRIAIEFEKENVQKTVELAAAAEAERLLAKTVDPRIQQFEKILNEASSEAERRAKDLKEVVKRTEEDASSIESLRGELARLKQRNDLTALADTAISNGDVTAYRQLEAIVASNDGKENKAAALSELFRVYNAYSLFSGVKRTAAISVDAHAINPKKNKEEDLDADDLLPLLKEEKTPLFRVKIGELLAPKLKQGSFKTAEILADALRTETSLEGFKVIGALLSQVTNHPADGKLDKRELLKWCTENRDQLRKADTDATPTPTPSPVASATSSPN